MLTNIRIENFKCFKNQSIPFSPMTLLTGFNAAGKSSAIQTLLLGRQIEKGPDGALAAPLNGACVKLGSVGDVRCHFGSKKEILISYQIVEKELALILDATDRDSSSLPFKSDTDSGTSEVLKLLRDIVFISATRNGTMDVYPVPANSFPVHADVGDFGQFAPWLFNKFIDDEVPIEKRHRNETAKTLRRQFNAWASEIFPGAEASVEEIEGAPLVKLSFRTSKQQQFKRPANIGYGLTYAFPIIVAGLLAKKGQILVIDSPEAHIHPMGQSRIGYFLGVMAASGVQVICETHSDHVLNGIRLAVADKSIRHSDVSIHFFQPPVDVAEGAPQITSPQIDVKGSLDIWPEGFFDQTDKDLAKLNGWV